MDTQTGPNGPAQQALQKGITLRMKILSPSQRKVFFAQLKDARQVHFARRLGEPGKTKVTSIHASGVGGVQPKHEVTMYRDEAARLQRRLRRLNLTLIISGNS